MSTSTTSDALIDPLTGAPRYAHLVAPTADVAGHVRALEARVLGHAIVTMCGLALVPSRDPRTLPLCSACHEIFRERTGAEDGWTDA